MAKKDEETGIDRRGCRECMGWVGTGAVWTMSSLRTSTDRLLATVDGLIAAGALLAISWPILLGPSWNDKTGTGLAFALSVAYPVGSIALAWMLVRSSRVTMRPLTCIRPWSLAMRAAPCALGSSIASA